MNQVIQDEIRCFVEESSENRFPDGRKPYFDEPLIGFASAKDPLFAEFKHIIGSFHMTPTEIMQNTFGDRGEGAKTVVCWILPITETTRSSNRKADTIPSREWAFTRAYGEHFNTQLRIYVINLLNSIGAKAVAPLLSGMWRPVRDPTAGLASTWSERHAAYAAGLGTFSLNDGFITEKGIAHRCGSIITDVDIAPTPRTCSDPWSNCLFFRDGSCGICIRRCPVDAISLQGHDKEKCAAHVYGKLRRSAGKLYGVMETGCGLCQTKVPCESCVPNGEDKKDV